MNNPPPGLAPSDCPGCQVCRPSDGDVTVDDPPGTLSTLPSSSLERIDGRNENENEIAWWVEFRRPGDPRILHRGVHLHLKKGIPFGLGEAGHVGG